MIVKDRNSIPRSSERKSAVEGIFRASRRRLFKDCGANGHRRKASRIGARKGCAL
jgi:hypothetical protein